MDNKTAHKAAFITRSGVYQWKRMPFGLMNSPASFQLLMSQVLKHLNWKCILVYVDDILLFSKNFQEHLSKLEQVFSHLKEAGLTLKPSKCTFAVDRVSYLGHVITNNGVETDKSKLEPVVTFPTPKNVPEVRSFLGLTGYYRRFIKDYARISTPLFRLLQNEVDFHWSTECQMAFDTLKQALISPPVLAYPNLEYPFILTCDAPGTAISYILSQIDETGKERVVAYGGRSLKQAERVWTTSEHECRQF